MDIDLVVWQVEVLHGRQGDHSEGFVDLEQVNFGQIPAGTLHQLVDSANRRGGEQRRGIGKSGMAMDHGQRFKAAFVCFGRRIGTSAAAPSEMELELAAVTVPPSRKAGELRDLVQARLGRLLVILDQALLFALGDFHQGRSRQRKGRS